MSTNIQILARQVEFKTPWFEIVAKRVTGYPEPYYALRMQDYVTVIALTDQDEVVLVKQYRPAIEQYTLEFPSGHVEQGETPEQAARRELAEECGFAAAQCDLLGTLLSDTGRHENRLWCFRATQLTRAGVPQEPEPGVERILLPRTKLPELIANADFNHAHGLAVLMMAVLKCGPEFLALK